MLEDKVRSVRIEAARVLSRVANERFADKSKPESKLYWDVLDEYRHGQVFLGDQPGAHLNLAVIHENLGEVRKAEASYKKAIELEKSFVPARMNLATLYAREARNGDAEKLLREAIKYQPEYAQAHYSMGLLLAENPTRLKEAVRYLATAARRAPHHSRMQYNYGLAMQRLGDAGEAERALRAALTIETNNPEYLNALLQFHQGRLEWKKALPYAERLLALYPNVPDLRVQVELIRRNASFN
jgi:Tfp pilus assembly protein PilF